jgi:ectoine hydroxylase-related dioxygenase (phytanoyl-CoA dioxygenase family)
VASYSPKFKSQQHHKQSPPRHDDHRFSTAKDHTDGEELEQQLCEVGTQRKMRSSSSLPSLRALITCYCIGYLGVVPLSDGFAPVVVVPRHASALRYGLYEVQEDMITRRGQFEEEIMPPSSLIAANKPKGAGSSGGFGGGGSKKSLFKTQAQAHAKVLRDQGVVRIDNVLSEEIADELKAYVYDLRATAEEEVAAGKVPQKQRFADVLLRKNRCDVTMPLTEHTYRGLHEALCNSPVGATFENLMGKNAVLYEFSCLMSDSGSDRQVIHPDTPFIGSDDSSPVLYTCFMALQDMTLDMGPTCWLPGTHTRQVHEAFQDESSRDENTDSPKDALLRSQPSVLGVLPKGSCGIFDSRLLHAGTANRTNTSRAILYFTFKNPKIGYPGNPSSMRPELAGKLTLSQLQKQLESFQKGKGCAELEALAAEME